MFTSWGRTNDVGHTFLFSPHFGASQLEMPAVACATSRLRQRKGQANPPAFSLLHAAKQRPLVQMAKLQDSKQPGLLSSCMDASSLRGPPHPINDHVDEK